MNEFGRRFGGFSTVSGGFLTTFRWFSSNFFDEAIKAIGRYLLSELDLMVVVVRMATTVVTSRLV